MDKLKLLLTQHIEKVLLGLIAVAGALVVYSGFNVKGLSSDENPVKLAENGANAKKAIASNCWEAIKNKEPERIPEEGLEKKAAGSRERLNEVAYSLPTVLSLITRESNQIKRRDPDLLPPDKLEVRAFAGAIAMNSKNPDPFAGAPPAPPRVKEEKKDKDKERKPTATTATPAPAFNPLDIVEGSMRPPTRGVGQRPARPNEPAAPLLPESPAPMFGPARLLPAIYAGDYVPQVAPADPTRRAATAPVAETRFGAVVLARVPFADQVKEFEKALRDATGYDPARDSPRYMFFVAERKEEPNGKWEVVCSPTRVTQDSQAWVGSPQELVDPSYADPWLTMPLPPLLLHKLEKFQLHSDTPKATQFAGAPVETPAAVEEPAGTPSDLDAPPIVPPVGPNVPGPVGRPGFPIGRGEGSFGPTVPGHSQQPGYGPNMTADTQANYRLLRFADLTAAPGKTYRYRVKVLLEDPNRPPKTAEPLNERLLDAKVLARLSDLQRTDPERKIYFRETKWSEPSAPIQIPRLGEMLAGTVTPEELTVLRDEAGRAIGSVPKTEASGTVVPVRWDNRLATFVPSERKVQRGSVLNFRSDVDVVNPMNLQILQIKNYDMRTDAVVVDLRGGDGPASGLKASGEVAIIDGDGRFLVRNELDDLESYRRHTYDFDDSMTAAQPGMMMQEMLPGNSGYPGAIPGGRGPQPGFPPGRGMAPPGAPPGYPPPGGRGGLPANRGGGKGA